MWVQIPVPAPRLRVGSKYQLFWAFELLSELDALYHITTVWVAFSFCFAQNAQKIKRIVRDSNSYLHIVVFSIELTILSIIWIVNYEFLECLYSHLIASSFSLWVSSLTFLVFIVFDLSNTIRGFSTHPLSFSSMTAL